MVGKWSKCKCGCTWLGGGNCPCCKIKKEK